ncbi:MAG: hypothetical protein ABSH11_09190 [Verrucomicrobiota bacterium]
MTYRAQNASTSYSQFGWRVGHCAGRMRYGQLMPCHPSRFLKELPPELVEDADAKDKQPVNPDAGKKMFDVLRSAIS